MKTQVLPLLDYCFAHARDEDAGSLEKERVYHALFSEHEPVKGKLEKLMVEAHKVVRTYLITQKYLSDINEFNQNLDYAVILRTRGLHERYRQLLAKLKTNQTASQTRDTTYYFNQFLLEDAIHDAESLDNQIKNDLNVPNVLHALEIYYHIHTLSRINTFLLQQKIANLSVPPIIENAIREIEVPKQLVDYAPVLHLNLEICQLLQMQLVQSEDLNKLFQLLLEYEPILSADDLRVFYAYLRNVCVLVANSYYDNEEIRKTLFELYKDNLKRGFLHYEGGLPSNAFLAVSLVAAIVRQFEWLYDFIEANKNCIIGDNETKDYYRLGKAIYFFGIGRYADCLDHIPATSPSIDFLVHGKRLELKALYEMKADLFSYKLDAFKMFLSRTSQKLFSDEKRLQHLNFANLLTQLMNSTPGDVRRSELMEKRVREKIRTSDWRWLLEKALELRR